MIERKEFQLQYVSTSDNVADALTKALGPPRFGNLRSGSNVENVIEAVKMNSINLSDGQDTHEPK